MTAFLGVCILLAWWVQAGALPAVCSPRNCIAGKAACVNNSTCVCQTPNVWGKGNFMCYKNDQVATEVKNDPRLTTFNNDTTSFPYPCRYLLTSVLQDLKTQYLDKIGNCTIQVHAFNSRHKGKIFVYGFEIAIRLEARVFTKSLSIIAYGTSGHVTEGGTDNSFSPDGPYGPGLQSSSTPLYYDAYRLIALSRYYIPDNNQYVFEVDYCGFRATFVPYDPLLGLSQPNMPGLSVAVYGIRNPKWKMNQYVVGLAPVSGGGLTLAGLRNLNPGFNSVHAILHRAITSGTVQNQPGASSKCSAVGACNRTKLVEAYKSCTWILETSTFINCISNLQPTAINSDAMLGFFIVCINQICNGGGNCVTLIQVQSNCPNPALQSLIGDQCG